MLTEEVVSVSQASRALELSDERIRQLADAGRLRAVRSPMGRLISAQSVRELVAERQTRRELKIA